MRTLTTVVTALSLSAVWGLAATAEAQTINGTLMEVETDQPISLGLIVMLTESGDSVTSAITDSRGRFSISSPEPGSFILIASAFGFKETPAGVFELGENGVMDVEFRVAAAPMPIEGFLVSLQRPVLAHNLVRNGFVRRISRGRGRFITPADIEKSAARTAADLLRGIPGVFLTQAGAPFGSFQGEFVRMRSAGDYCAPTIYLDGSRLPPQTSANTPLHLLVPLQVIDAIEIYRRPAEIPIEYATTESPSGNAGGCGVLVIWTKTR